MFRLLEFCWHFLCEEYMYKWNSGFSKNHKIELSSDSEGVVGATAAWVYQKWAANVSESVFRVFGSGLGPIFRENHQNSRSQHLQPKLWQKLWSPKSGGVSNFGRIDHQDGETDFVRYFSGRSAHPCSFKEKSRGRHRGVLNIPNLGLSIFRYGILWDPATTFLDLVI